MTAEEEIKKIDEEIEKEIDLNKRIELRLKKIDLLTKELKKI